MKKITIEITDKEFNILQALLKMKGGITDTMRTVFVDGLIYHRKEVMNKSKDVYDEYISNFEPFRGARFEHYPKLKN